MHSKTCKTCLREFETSRSHTVFCCRLCHRRDPINKGKEVSFDIESLIRIALYSDRPRTYKELQDLK